MATTTDYPACGPCCGAWYCVDTGAGCPGEALFLTPADVADVGITKCSGPYASEAAALAVCPSFASPGTPTISCAGAPGLTRGVWYSYTDNGSNLNNWFMWSGLTAGNSYRMRLQAVTITAGSSWGGHFEYGPCGSPFSPIVQTLHTTVMLDETRTLPGGTAISMLVNRTNDGVTEWHFRLD